VIGYTDEYLQYQLNLISFNMHGINQGFSVIENLIENDLPHLFLVQEHWLTPENLYKLEKFFPEYFSRMFSHEPTGWFRYFTRSTL